MAETGSKLPARTAEPTTEQPPPKPAAAALVPYDPKETALLMADYWGGTGGLDVKRFMPVAKAIHSSFPHWAGWQIINYFDLLGGTTLYLNADGYMDIANSHPRTEAPPLLIELRPGTPEWNQWLGEESKPDDFAAAYLCEFKRTDRPTPFREANYCLADDALLFDYFGPKNARQRRQKKDWRPLAMKIARTRAIRRCLRIAFSPTEAAAIFADVQVKQILEQAIREELPAAIGSPEDPYAAVPAVTTPADAVIRPPAVEDMVISEQHRRHLFRIVSKRDTSPKSPHEALKDTILEIYQQEGQTELTVDQVSTKTITYTTWAKVVERITEKYPFKDEPPVEVSAEVVGSQAPEQANLLDPIDPTE